MPIDHVRLGEDGRIVIPASARRDLGLKPGETLVIESDGTSLLVRSYESVIQETQDYFGGFVTEGVSEVDDLIAERRAEATKEEAEAEQWHARKPRG